MFPWSEYSSHQPVFPSNPIHKIAYGYRNDNTQYNHHNVHKQALTYPSPNRYDLHDRHYVSMQNIYYKRCSAKSR